MNTFARVGAATESPAWQGAFKILMVLFGIAVTALLSVLVGAAEHGATVADNAAADNSRQDTVIAVVQAQSAVTARVLNDAIVTQQRINQQQQINTDDIRHNSKAIERGH